MFDRQWLLSRLAMLIPLVLSLTVHEWAHAMSAFRLGDDTAERQGRLTLNPLVHIDPVGTILLPLLGVPFGWARPVPVDPARFRRGVSMRAGMIWTAAAGPLSNVVLAFVCALLYTLTLRFQPMWLDPRVGASGFLGGSWGPLLDHGLAVNLALAVFNAIPIPPLDGSRVVDGLMPQRYRSAWEGFCQFGPMLMLALLLAPQFLGVHPLAAPMAYAHQALTQAAAWVVGL